MKELQNVLRALGPIRLLEYSHFMNRKTFALLTTLFAVILSGSVGLGSTGMTGSESRPERSRCYLNPILKDGVFSTKAPKSADFILVDKTNKRMYLMLKNKVLKAYPIALGFEPLGHKQQEGDGKTPEGIYSISHKNPQSQFFLSLGVSYPNSTDRKSAAERGVSPGGDIMIHGLPNDPLKLKLVSLIHPFYNWTEGCIAVTNEEMQEIYSAVRTGTKIEICP